MTAVSRRWSYSLPEQGRQQAAELAVAEDGHRHLRHLRRAHTGHRRGRDLALLLQPAEELLEREEPVGGRRRLVGLDQVLDDALDVLPAQPCRLQRHPATLEEGHELAGRFGVALPGPWCLVGGSERALPGRDEVGQMA